MKNWKTTLGGALSALGTSIAGVSTVAAFTDPKYQALAVYFIIGGALLSAFGKFFGMLFAEDSTPTGKPVDQGNKAGPVIILILVLGLGGLMFGTTGCNTTPQRATYITATTADISVEAAVRAYNVFAAQGKTTVAQNLQVKAAYEKYQAAFAVLCDVGAVYAATSTTNAPAAAALQQATLNASASIADVINLIQSFGVKFNH